LKSAPSRTSRRSGNDPGYPLGGNYILTQDLDASVTAIWNSSAGFKPIGTDYNNPFTGTFDGQGHVISGLVINRPTEGDMGLFGSVGSGGEIMNLGIEGGAVTGGGGHTGGLVGENFGMVTNCYATGAVTGSGDTGGLVGVNEGTVTVSFWDALTSGQTSSAGGTGCSTDQMK